MGNRELLKSIAEDTLKIIEKGYYVYDKRNVNIKEDTEKSVGNSILYTPKETTDLLAKLKPGGELDTHIEVTDETTLAAAKRLKEKGCQKVLALNFASAKHAGGGFLNGSQAQEESLARSSSLYPTLTAKNEFYEYNRKLNTALYSDYMIYSPEVPVFKSDKGALLENPYSVSFLTSPAVNAGVVRERESLVAKNQILPVMTRRIEKILAIAAYHEYESLVLGAFGCGVFKNPPKDIALIFKKALDTKFKGKFKEVAFAVYDSTPGKTTYTIFKNLLS